MPNITLKKDDIRNDLILPIAVFRSKHHITIVGHENCPHRKREEQALNCLLRLLERLN